MIRRLHAGPHPLAIHRFTSTFFMEFRKCLNSPTGGKGRFLCRLQKLYTDTLQTGGGDGGGGGGDGGQEHLSQSARLCDLSLRARFPETSILAQMDERELFAESLTVCACVSLCVCLCLSVWV